MKVNMAKDRKEIQDYLDCYKDDIASLNIRLVDIISHLKYDEINNKLLKECGFSMEEIHDIFNHHTYTNMVASIFDEFSIELSKIDANNLSEEELESFLILEKIFEEINRYIYLYFIDRTMVDVKVFKDSLESNIKYFLSELKKEDHDLSEIDFL